MRIFVSNGQDWSWYDLDEQEWSWYDLEERNFNPHVIRDAIKEDLGDDWAIENFDNTWGIRKSHLMNLTLEELCDLSEEIEHFKTVLADLLETVDGEILINELCDSIKLNFKGDVK